ncbi:MAG: amino acid adenylation domain-containing protein [Synergistaceae bacterium]|nr:amino acid adenylation domain-containing protein [Synergistaceae bacterium]
MFNYNNITPPPRVVSDYLDRAAKLFPDKIAFADSKNMLSYSELQRRSKQTAAALISRKLFKQSAAVFLDKSVECIIAFMGAAYSGNFYTVIDTKMPFARVKKIIDTLEPAIIITDHKNFAKAQEFAGRTEILCLEDTENIIIDEALIKSVTENIINLDVLYVLFTSGSTGTPKGVIIGHRSVIDYIEWAAETFNFNETQIFGNQAPFYFDNSVLDIYSTLRNAATMYIIPQSCFAFPVTLLNFIRDKNINTVFFVPTVLCRLANMNIIDKVDISCLKNILFAGEVMPAKQLNIWKKYLPDALYANLYGPTEITVDCTYYIVNREIADDEPVPIGYPCRNSNILILNQNDEEAKINEQGELCVRGTSLAYGYYNNPEKTAEVFVQNPLNKNYRELIYRTGDLVHYNLKGEIIYDGRKDFQVKHSGHRIELGEIETAVSSIKGVEFCCCLHENINDKLVLFYSGNLASNEIRKTLADMLPDYMLPNICEQLDKMPLNLNGKIDRAKLKARLKEF